MSSSIVGLGHYAPRCKVPNSEIEQKLKLESGWIERRTGIKFRRYASDDQALTDIALPAAKMALSDSGLKKKDIALVILATSTPDHLLPPSAPLLAYQLGLNNAGAVDLAGACSGFLYALVMADGFIRTQKKPVLIIAANILSRRINPNELSSCVLFADAAGAMLLTPSDKKNAGLLASQLVSNGSEYDLIKIKSGGSRQPFTQQTDIMDTTMTMTDGPKVFSSAVKIMTKVSKKVLKDSNVQPKDVTRFVPHQANIRIMKKVREKLFLPEACLENSLTNYGNSSAATIPFSLSLSNQKRALKSDENLLMSAAGAGMMGGAVLFKI